MDYTKREDYFTSNVFAKYAFDKTTNLDTTVPSIDYYYSEMFIYDLIIINKLYTTAYKLIKNYFNITLNNDIDKCKKFYENLNININAPTSKSNISIFGTTLLLNLGNKFSNIYKLMLNTNYTSAASAELNSRTATSNDINNQFDITDGSATNTAKETPLYHYNISKIPIIENLMNDIRLEHNTDAAASQSYGLLADTISNIPYVLTFNDVTVDVSSGAVATIASNGTSSGALNNVGVITLSINIYDATTINSAKYINKNSIKTAYSNYNITEYTVTNKDKYEYQRVFIYLDAFNKILNTDFKILLPTLKYYMYYYNILVYNVAIQNAYFRLQKYRLTFSTVTATSTTTSDRTTTSLNDDISKLKDNLNYITTNSFNVPSNTISIKETTLNLITNINEVKKTFNENQTELNATINKYNNYLILYNKILFYYKIIIAFVIFLTIVIIIIFSSSSIDNNSKISIYIMLIIFIIIIYFFYNNNVTIENFSIAHDKTATTYGNLTGELDIDSYKLTVNNFLTFLSMNISNSDTSLFASDMNSYMRSLTLDKKRKAEFYKIKQTTLYNNIEIMKKLINYYYNLIVLIATLIVILLIGLILYLALPHLLLQIVILCAILLIIAVYIFTYRTQKSTRIYENKNYWANYNPSKITLENV
jgi:hypothetical protein